MALLSLLPATKASECKVEGQWCRKVPSIQKKMADVFFRLWYNSFMIICSHANCFSFSFVDRQNTYSCKSDLFANFSAVYIFPCTLNGDIPQFLLQLAVADDDGHLTLFECSSLS